jgi:magnesium transporter
MSRRSKKTIRKRGLPPGTLVYTGSREVRNTEAYTIWYHLQDFIQHPNYAPTLGSRTEGVLWVDIRNLTEVASIERAGADFEIHPLALEDILNTQQRTKIDEYNDAFLMIVPNMRFEAATDELVIEQIGVYTGPHYILSFQEDPDDTFSMVRQRIEEAGSKIRRKGPDFLLYSILDHIVDGYFEVIDTIENSLFDIESALPSATEPNEQKARLFHLKYTVTRMRQRILPLREIASRLTRTDHTCLDDSNEPYFRDLYDHTVQVLDGLDNLRELINNVESLYQAEMSNRMNNVMRLLTIISTIFIPLSWVAGVYGMNFDHMPELRWRYGYFIVLGLMLALVAGMLTYFRRKRWL